MTDTKQVGREVERSDTMGWAARIGLVAYGLVYLLVGWVAIQLAFGDHSQDASPKGAMAELSRQPLGRVLVWAVAIGLVLLVAWRLAEAAFGHRASDGADRLRERVVSAGKAVLYAALSFNAFKVATGAGSKSSQKSSQSMTAKLMDLPGGQWLVAAVGLAIIGYAGTVAWQGWKEKFAEHLTTEGKQGWSGASYLLIGQVGHVAKGIAFALVGGLVCYAGVSHEPDKSGGLDQALQTVLGQPFGPYLLVVVGIGIACYGLFCFAQARHLDR